MSWGAQNRSEDAKTVDGCLPLGGHSAVRSVLSPQVRSSLAVKTAELYTSNSPISFSLGSALHSLSFSWGSVLHFPLGIARLYTCEFVRLGQ